MSKYTLEQIKGEIRPLSGNAFIAFFQKIWRWWLGVWYGFSEKHPVIAKLLQQFFVMFMLSNAVTIYQMLVMMFLPYAFKGLWYTPFVWPAIALPWTDAAGEALNYAIFNEPVKFLNAAGEVVLASTSELVSRYQGLGYTYEISGLGNFIAFEIAVFTAQCINLPLQRNITFHSNGNIYIQAIWYFIGWVLISIGLNALWGIMNPLMQSWNWNKFIIDLIKTVLTGGVSMVIFFVIFLIIFPDMEKVAKKAREKAEKLKASGASQEAIAKAETEALGKEEDARVNSARLEKAKAMSVCNNKCMRYESVLNAINKMKASELDEKGKEKLKGIEGKLDSYLEEACMSIDAKNETAAQYEKAVKEVKTAKEKRGEDTSKVS